MFKIDTPRYFEAGSGVIALRGRKNNIEVLIIKRSKQNDVVFPKGHIEDGESLQETAVREALEESGRTVVLKEQLGSEEYVWKDDTRGVVTVRRIYWFLAESVREGEPHPEESEGKMEALWVPVDEARNLLTYPSGIKTLERAVKAYKGL